MEKGEVLLDSYVLQKDMRIRLPKQIIANVPADIGTVFDIYYNSISHDIVLRVSSRNDIINYAEGEPK